MTLDEDKIYNIDHESEKPFPEQLAELVNGKFDGKMLTVDNKIAKATYEFFTELDNIKLVIHKSEMRSKVNVRHNPILQSNDFVYLMMLKEGEITHIYESENNIEVFGPKRQRGIMITNLKYPLINQSEATGYCEWFTILVRKTTLIDLIEGAKKEEVKKIISSNDPWLFFEPFNLEVVTALEKIFSVEEKVARKLKIYGQSLIILAETMNLLGSRKSADTSRLSVHDTARMFEVKEYITQDLSVTPNLEEICNEFGLSRSKLIRDFKAEFGRPVYKFYNHVRMEEARVMLVDKGLSVTEVSQELGFKGLSKFSDAFKNFYGMSPKTMVELSTKME
ncbi:helix-turn-helix domain-containing protein [Flammeovirga agarivorans]|uniref:Helix-turn-helix transcriptional regulator n=1 Tax=Flammeovirga agarivorans TaxID=2726742 RepID=A0A7X8SHH3_9BACT|nr:AraC family transcriptional regulator [Flammeovirga agarivorans]NLR90203.1 helix-turn-helix transcriptional regulator [Flammeovirga agarivorans]